MFFGPNGPSTQQPQVSQLKKTGFHQTVHLFCSVYAGVSQKSPQKDWKTASYLQINPGCFFLVSTIYHLESSNNIQPVRKSILYVFYINIPLPATVDDARSVAGRLYHTLTYSDLLLVHLRLVLLFCLFGGPTDRPSAPLRLARPVSGSSGSVRRCRQRWRWRSGLPVGCLGRLRDMEV